MSTGVATEGRQLGQGRRSRKDRDVLWAQEQEAWLFLWPQTDLVFSTIFVTYCVTKSLYLSESHFFPLRRGVIIPPCGGWYRLNVATYAEHVFFQCLVQSKGYAEPSIQEQFYFSCGMPWPDFGIYPASSCQRMASLPNG